MTETGSGVVYDGRPLDGVEVRIDDDGQIHLRGPMLLRAYRDGTDALDGDGWLATGDIGRWLDDGRLHVEGRAGDLIITGGENVWPEPVEAVLRDRPGVLDVAVTRHARRRVGPRRDRRRRPVEPTARRPSTRCATPSRRRCRRSARRGASCSSTPSPAPRSARSAAPSCAASPAADAGRQARAALPTMTRLPSGSSDVGDALAPRLVDGLLDDRAAGGPDRLDDGVAVGGVDPQRDALLGRQVDGRVVADPEVRRPEVDADVRRRPLGRERVADVPPSTSR